MVIPSKQIGRATSLKVGALAILAVLTVFSPACNRKSNVSPAAGTSAPEADPSKPQSVELAQSQLTAVKIEPVGTYLFPVEREAVGNIDFDDDLSVPVFPPLSGTNHLHQGRTRRRCQEGPASLHHRQSRSDSG